MTRVCLLTGASGLLGTAFIARCAAQFSIVAVHHRHQLSGPTQSQFFVDPLDPARTLAENAHPVYALWTDLARQDSIEALCAEVLDRFGRVDVLINAAVHRTRSDLRTAGALDGAERAFLVNVLAPLRLAAALTQKYWCSHVDENIANRRHILNISSTAGVDVYPDQGQAIYSASKAALNFATYHLASDLWGIGIRANAVAPNSFPGHVTTARVIDEMVKLDASEDTGRIVVIDA